MSNTDPSPLGAVPDPPSPDLTLLAVRKSETDGEQHRLLLETWIRGITLLMVVFAIVAYPFYALFAGTTPADLAQYIAPITGIAGAVVGYWFGQASRKLQPKEHA